MYIQYKLGTRLRLKKGILPELLDRQPAGKVIAYRSNGLITVQLDQTDDQLDHTVITASVECFEREDEHGTLQNSDNHAGRRRDDISGSVLRQ